MRERNRLARCTSRPFTRVLIAFLVICLSSSTSIFAQPANDDCGMAQVAPTDGSCVDGNNTLATSDIGNGSCVANGAGAANVWFQFTAQGADYNINGIGLGGSVEITLLQFQGTPCTFADAVEFDCGPTNINADGALIAGQTYYVVVTSSTGTEGNFSICIENPMDNPPPPNDDPCSAQPTPPNGNCTTGTTVDATTDWSNPSCTGLGENSVWYSVTLGPTANSVDINTGSGDITGDISVMIGSFATDCSSAFSFAGQYCGPPNGTFNVQGLTGGTTYYVVVSTEDANAGTFDVCVTEMGPNPACAINQECSGAIDISAPAPQQNCQPGCNEGVSPGLGGGGCFDFSTIPTVWYTFTTDANTAFVNLNIGSPQFDLPQVGIYSGGCGSLLTVQCGQGAAGNLDLTQVPVSPNTTYYVAVGSLGGQEGSFTLCLTYVPGGGTNCTTNIDINATSASLGSPLTGPFQPGETVNFCANISFNSDVFINWIHGVVPTFGECWDPISFSPTGEPLSGVTVPGSANWTWFEDGVVTYSYGGGVIPQWSPVGAGWFVNNVPVGNPPLPHCVGVPASDPNCSWGDPTGTGTFLFCWDLTARMYPECDQNPSYIDCGISIKTYGDGETGGWDRPGCDNDIPWFGNFSLNCCAGPEMLPLSLTSCSDNQFDIFLEDLVLPPTDPTTVGFTWTVNAPASVTGASGCMSGCGNIISQILDNTSSVPQVVTYTVSPRTIDGCFGTGTDIVVTVLPSVEASINQPDPVCSGQCVQLFGSASGGDGTYTYEWDNMNTGIFNEVCPSFTTTYSLTVTDGNGCTGVTEVTVEANPNFDVIFAPDNYAVICEGDPQPTLTAFGTIGDNWLFNWDLPGPPFMSVSPFIVPDYPGDNIYYVTLTDIASGCTGEGEINIVVNESPMVLAFTSMDEVCQSDVAVDILTGIPPGGTWAGNVNPDGWFIPNTPGLNTLTYTFDDGSGCPGSWDVEIDVLPTPETPVFQPANTDLCQGETATFCIDAVNGATGYSWTLPTGVTINGPTDQTCIEVVWGSVNGGDICVSGINSCGNGPETCLPITISPTPPEPGPITDTSPVCVDADGIVYSIDPVTGATGYSWTVMPGTYTGSGTSITVDWGIGASGQICVTASNACGDGPEHCETVNFNTPPADPGLPTNPVVCAGEMGVVYSTSGSVDATSYTWQVTGGSIASGQGSDMITVDWNNVASGSVCVTAVNTCGNSNEVCTSVTLDQIPANAGSITGLDIVCQNTDGIDYMVGTTAGADGYTWTVTSGITIVSGQGTQTLTVDFGVFTAGQICVSAFNDCGASDPFCYDVDPDLIPVAPSQLPDDVLCEGATDLSYTVNVPGATSYNWVLLSGVTNVTGAGTGTIGFNLGTASTGDICVSALNDCGEGPQMCFNLMINSVPAQPTNVQYTPVICAGSAGAETYTVDQVADATGYVWSVPTGANITAGQGSQTITVDWGTVAGGEICVAAENQCGLGPDFCFDVTADQPLAPPTVVCDLNATTLTEVGFTITHPVATDFTYTYTVNGGAVMGPDAFTGNPVVIPAGANQDVVITVTALANGNVCGDSQTTTQLCTANDCTNNPPTIDAPTVSFCPDSPPYQLIANPPGGTFSGTGVDPSGMFTPGAAGNVIVTYMYTDVNNCPQTNTATLMVNDFPIANAGMDDLLSCADTDIQLDGGLSSSGADIEYSWSGPGIISGGDSPTPTIDATGTYTLVITNTTTGCTAMDEVDVNPDSATPTADAGLDQLITCDDPMVTLMGSGTNGSNLTYEWTGPGITPANMNEPQPIVNVPGTYSLIVTAGNGCSSTEVFVDVTQAVDPVAVAGNDDFFLCSTIDFDLDGTIGTTTGADITYLWTGPGNITNHTTLNPTVDAPGVYTLLVTDTATGCTGSDEVELEPDLNAPMAFADPTAEITCFVPMATLQGSGSATNMSYTWSGPGITPANMNDQNPMVDQPGNYLLIVTDLDNGCSSGPAMVIVTQATDPIAVAGMDASLTCANPTTQLDGFGSTVDPNVTYLWTGPGTITNETSLQPTIDVAGIFVLTVTNNITGCFATDEVELMADGDAPIVEAGTDLQITCLTTSVVLQGSATNGSNFEYTWTGPDITPANENEQNPTVSIDGQYFLTVENLDNGCSAGDFVTVLPTPPIVVMASGPNTFSCATTDLQLSGAGSDTGPDYLHTWTGPGTIDDENTLTPTVYAAGSYVLTTVNLVTGCSETATHIVDPDQGAPMVDAGLDTEITCILTTADLGVNTDATNPTYTWTGPGITPGNMNMQNITVAVPGIYNVLVEDGSNGCTNSDEVEVLNLTAEPIANAGADVTKNCSDLTIELDGSFSQSGANITYLWTGPGTILNEDTETPTVDVAGIFTLTVTNTATGCSSFDMVEIFPDDNAPDAMITGEDQLNCNNDFEITLQGSTTSTSTNLLYTWSGPGITAMNMNDENPVVNVMGLYELAITDLDNMCEGNTVQFNITEAQPPVAEINSGNINTIDCFTDNLTMVAVGCDVNPNLLIEWWLNGTLQDQLNGECEVSFEQGMEDGLFQLIVEDELTGCRDTADIMITDNTAFPGALAGDDQFLDCETTEVTLMGSSLQPSGVTYLWEGPGINASNMNDQNPVVTVPGNYSLTVTEDLSGCDDIDAVVVDDISLIPQADAGADQFLDCSYQAVQLGTVPTGTGLTYSWEDANGQVVGSTPQIDVADAGTYTLNVFDPSNNCPNSAIVTVNPPDNEPTDFDLEVQNPNCPDDQNGFINILSVVGGTEPFNFTLNDIPMAQLGGYRIGSGHL